MKIVNTGKQQVRLEKVYSACLDMDNENFELLTLHGSWGRERHIQRRVICYGKQLVSSAKGKPGHQEHPFIALVTPGTNQQQGRVYGMHFVYSGNFIGQAELTQFDTVRMVMGIHQEEFCWNLRGGESFQAPEVVLTFSEEGLGKMTRSLHDFYRQHMIRSKYKDQKRPILINNWEATYFDFNEDTIVEIAKSAKKAGIEMFVLDDGWFGTRNDDKQGLGDWFANLNKLEHGISGLSKRIEEECGMKFGLWFEPEMVNENSDLFRKHPDYRIETPGRKCSHGRNEFVLDFSRKEVVDCIYDQMEKLLADSKVSYIKWDMNRSITECFSKGWAANKQGEIFHRYILGVYDLYERLTKRFPEILFESCASGGGRFDPGMLYYAPQTWTSDDSDAIERIKIQYGTSMVYPLSSMGAHVSVTPNHQLFRNTPLSTRANVAYFGAFGYELNIAKLSEEEQEEIKKQVEFVKQYRGLIQKGTFYRLLSPFEGNIAAWIVVSEDKKDAIMGYYKILNDVNCPYRRLCLHGLDEKMEYTIEGVDGVYSGRELMKAGMITSDPSAGQVLDGRETCTDFWSKIYLLHGEK